MLGHRVTEWAPRCVYIRHVCQSICLEGWRDGRVNKVCKHENLSLDPRIHIKARLAPVAGDRQSPGVHCPSSLDKG